MINRLIHLSIRQRVLMLIFTAMLLAWGVFSFLQLPIEAYPDVMNTQVSVITQWPGHAAEEVEKLVTIPLETSLNGVPHVASLRSRSLFGLSVVYLNFEDGVDDYFAREQVTEAISAANLPANLQPNLSPLSSATGEIMRYVVVGPVPLTQLKMLEDWTLEREFKSIPGVADVSSFGGTIKQYQVFLDPKKLRAYDLTIKTVTDAISNANANAGGNFIERGSEEFVVRGIGLLQTPGDIENILLSTTNGTPLRVKDVATVQVGYQSRLGKVGFQGHGGPDVDDAVLGVILLRRGENPTPVLEAVHKKIEALNNGILPKGVKVVPIIDRTDLVKTTSRTVEHNLIEGMLLVAAVLFLFLGNIRAAAIAALTIPFSLLFAFSCMNLIHVPANLLSLGAIDFGIIVNGSVILVEAIYHRLTRRLPNDMTLTSILSAARSVESEIVVTTFIIVLAYLPLFTMQSVEQKMFAPMACTIALALVGSLLMAVLVVPALCYILLHGPLKQGEPKFMEWLGKAYPHALSVALRYPLVVLSLAISLLGVAILLLPGLGTEFLPHLDEGNLYIRASLPTTISYTEASHIVPKIRAIIGSYQPVDSVQSQVGRPDDGTDATGFYNAEFLVNLIPYGDWKKQFPTKAALIQDMNAHLEQIPGVTFNFSQNIEDNVEEAVTGVKGELAVKLFGDDIEELETKADAIQQTIMRVPGIVDVDTFKESGEPQVQVRVDRDRCARFGLNIQDVEDTIETAIGGKTVTQVLDGERKFDVLVRLNEDSRSDVERIKDVTVTTPDGVRVPLVEVATITLGRGASFIYRESNHRFIAIKFGVRGRDIGGAVAEAQQKVRQSVPLPSGYYTVWGGEFESMQRAGARLAVIVPVTLLLIYLILFVLFGSTWRAGLVMLNVPLALIGGVMALYLVKMHLSVAAAVGFIALFGVAVQNGVLMVSQFDRLVKEGVPLADAVLQGAADRLRSVLATAVLASIGLLPAAVSTGIGSDTQKPLAIVIIGGLMSATLLTLFVLPVAYRLAAAHERRRASFHASFAAAGGVGAMMLILAFLLTSPVQAGPPSQTTRTRLYFGRSALSQGHWTEAERQFRFGVTYSLTHGKYQLAEAYAALAQVYLQTGRPLRATESAEAALRQNSKEPTALQVQKTLADDPKLLTVRTTVQEQVKRDPNNAEAHAVLSALLLHAEEWEDARTEATTALKLKPDESHALAVLAQLAMHEEKWDEARHILEQALDHDEKNEHLWGTLAEVAIGQKDAEMAVRAARYAVSLAPEHKKWHDLLIAAYELAGNKAAAEQERQKNTHP